MGNDNYKELIKKLKELNVKHEHKIQSILEKQHAEHDRLVEQFAKDVKLNHFKT